MNLVQNSLIGLNGNKLMYLRIFDVFLNNKVLYAFILFLFVLGR